MCAGHLISAAMIVRNEAAHLPACLSSLRPLVDEIVIVDTGSEDDTVAIAESFGARVEHLPWRGDFADSAQSLARAGARPVDPLHRRRRAPRAARRRAGAQPARRRRRAGDACALPLAPKPDAVLGVPAVALRPPHPLRAPDARDDDPGDLRGRGAGGLRGGRHRGVPAACRIRGGSDAQASAQPPDHPGPAGYRFREPVHPDAPGRGAHRDRRSGGGGPGLRARGRDRPPDTRLHRPGRLLRPDPAPAGSGAGRHRAAGGSARAVSG